MIYTTITLDVTTCNQKKYTMWKGDVTRWQARTLLDFIDQWCLGITFSSCGCTEDEKQTTSTIEILKTIVKYMLDNDNNYFTEDGIEELKELYKKYWNEEYKKLPF